MKIRVDCVLFVLFLFFIVIGLVVGCGPPPKEQLKDFGLFGKHSLMRIESFKTVQGTVSGGFFLGIGSVNGSLGSEFKIQFYWSPKPGEIIVTTLPYSKFRFIIDKTKNTPTVEFLFNDSWLNNETEIVYTEKKFPNLNDFVMSDDMELARVRISSTTLEKEIYLPKIR